MSTVYAMGGSNEELILQLCDPDPVKRGEAAEAIGVLHIYLALPQLLDAARDDADEAVRVTARQAVVSLMPSEEAARRAVAGLPPVPTAAPKSHATQREQAAAVIARFKEYVLDRKRHADAMISGTPEQKSEPSRGPQESDIVGPAVEYLETWGGQSAADLDEVGMAAANAIGAIARFLEVRPETAGIKYLSYGDANARVAAYEAVVEAEAGRQDA